MRTGISIQHGDGKNGLDLTEMQNFRDVCYEQYREQVKTHDVLTDPPPVIVQVLDALMDEILRLRRELPED